MLIASKASEPFWKPVLGAEVLFAPIDRTMVLRARRAARGAAQDADPDAAALVMLDEMGDALSHALITAGVRDWKNVGQQRFDDNGAPVLGDDGEPIFDPLPFSAENLALLLADPVIFDEFDTAYVMPFITRERQRAEPGNASSASPNGTGGAETPDSDTAGSRAKPKKGSAAPRARTSSTKPRVRKKRTSGES